MKLRTAVISVLCVGLVCSLSILGYQAHAQGKTVVMPKITVLNPMGTPPAIQAKQMAPRLDTLDGKTIYFVNTGYIGTDRLMAEMMDWFKANYQKTKLQIRTGGMTNIPANVMTEIGEKGDAAIVGLGH
ncbi:MAG: hypothetical protein P8Z37_11115 [Acidobacteriota bacterium]